ncbi:MAG TPA: hypothetical protein VF476_14260 [Chitinophagaceae bacterium]
MKTILITSIALFSIVNTTTAQIKVNPLPATERVQPVTPAVKAVAFRLSDATLAALPANSSVALNTSLKEFDLSNNARGGQFTAPENGVYHFDVHVNISPSLTDYKNYLRFHLSLMKGNDVAEKTTLMNPQTSYTTTHTLRISTTLLLNKGDVISVKYNADAEPGTAAVNVLNATFSGFKVASLTGGAQEGTIR